MERNEFKSRLKQYKKAREENPGLKYWEWKLKYDSAPQPDSMPSQPQSDLMTPVSQQSEDRAHRWDNSYVETNRQLYDSPYDDARYYDYRKPRFELRKGDVHYSNPTLLKWMGKFGKVIRGGSLLGEIIQNLFPSEEAELIEDLRVKTNKQNKWLTGQEAIPLYDEGGEVGENDFMKQFGKQVSYKPEETSWWSDVKNWWNDLTGMKNYAYGNCATTPGGKHTKECAHYSNSILRNQGYKNIVGDAWTRAANSGMKKITSGYDGLTKPIEWNENDAHEYLQSAAANFASKIDTTGLKPYDVIGLYYPDSPNTKKAFEQGRWGETQTHTGHTVIGKDGTHYVVHNVDGHLKINKLADMLTGDYEYKPVSAYRPKKYADGGEVEPDPLEVLERSRPKIAGIPINDRPLDTYGPFEELGMATLLGGLGGAALRGLFKNYGKMTAAIAFGDYGNENALVVKKPLRKGDPTVKPISTGNISEGTRDFYREYVMPLSDHLTEQEKLDFINNDANFTYNVYPESRFDEGVLGFRNKYTGEIALNENILDDPIIFGRTMAHESDHALLQVKERPSWQTLKINRNSPRTKEQKKTRMGSNSEADATHEANKWDIVNNFELENGRKPTLKEFQQHIDVVPAKTLSSFRNRDSYGRMYEVNEIKKLAQKHLTAYDYSKWLDTSKRNTLKYVPATIPFMFATNKEEA